ncbi:sel1 repeat family protein [Rhodoblastus acidophilus]|uniref:Sel1 repeat family protein n=1 Tax=Candidatus Rhodoblastus alkanivorans TaxID=2954117 RepID=A0ABS9ZBA9_9HYPH|nr:tetratricopeptide repeat protein [Candidatus Rhodoblastus alkanivorans]MCI4679112.1 sel1 repeat family protein [Candidatus Rhodoblastus alkanivorans]MCI4685000.1 sel1 repeat family protein [Candidatus Rhodoblastus alkanivorans]MDI4643229.1 sel1 repeat family protein [Rhodoblastus acidophilus]
MKHVFLLIVAMAGAGPAFAQDTTEADWIRDPAMGNYKAYAEFKMAHYDAARHVWEVLAGRGNPDALFNLAILAEDGLGEPKDLAKAESLYVAAADAGGFKAQYRLGVLYSGDGPLRNIDKARHFLSLAAQQGDHDAADRLASLAHPDRPPSEFEQAELLSSSGRQAEAAAIYQRLADSGDRRAQTRLAWMYESGQGVERDLDEAGRRFMIAGQAGDAEAQYALAVMFKTGKGRPVDAEQAEQWLQRSAAQKYPPARAALAAQHSDE